MSLELWTEGLVHAIYIDTLGYRLTYWIGMWGDNPAMAHGPRLHLEGAWIALVAARLCTPDSNLLSAHRTRHCILSITQHDSLSTSITYP